jgi:hypothetical protein
VALKRGLMPLDKTQLLGPEDVDRLRQMSITSVEEMVGAIDADPVALAHYLGRSQPAVEDLRDRALQLVPEATQAELQKPVHRFKLGALPPEH